MLLNLHKNSNIKTDQTNEIYIYDINANIDFS